MDRRSIGKRSKKQGDFFEKIIENYNKNFLERYGKPSRLYKLSKEKIPNTHKYKTKLRSDFEGWTKTFMGKDYDYPVHVELEAKYTTKKSFYLSSLKYHQYISLLELNDYGGIGILSIGHEESGKCYHILIDEKFDGYIQQNKCIDIVNKKMCKTLNIDTLKKFSIKIDPLLAFDVFGYNN